MPPIKDAMGADLSGYQTVEMTASKSPNPPFKLGANTVLRCPLPPFNADPDVLRQVETGASMPTRRIIPLPPFIAAATSVVTASNLSASSSSSGGSASISLSSASVSLNVAALSPSALVSETVAVTKKSFQLLSISATAPCEVRLYGTALSQLIDSTRATDAPVPAEISQNVITDVIFDTVPYIWGWQNRIAANQDTPQTGTLYVSVINNTTTSIAGLTVTITYLPLES